MNILNEIGHFFAKLFGAHSSIVEKVLHEVSGVVNKALPYVRDLSSHIGVIDGLEHNAILEKIAAWITKHVSDVSLVENFMSANANAPLQSILHNAAVFVTAHVGGLAGKLLSDLDTGVQLALSVVKLENPELAGGQIGAAALLRKK